MGHPMTIMMCLRFVMNAHDRKYTHKKVEMLFLRIFVRITGTEAMEKDKSVKKS